MSGSNYYKDQDELAAAVGLTTRQLRKYTQLPDCPRKTKSGWPKRCVEFIKEQQEQGLTGDGSMRDEKLKREGERLDIIIARERGELISKDEAERETRKMLASLRSAADAWRDHQTAKYPDMANMIDELYDLFLARMRDAE